MARTRKSSPTSKKRIRTCSCGYAKSDDRRCGCDTDRDEVPTFTSPFDSPFLLDEEDIADEPSWAFESFFENHSAAHS